MAISDQDKQIDKFLKKKKEDETKTTNVVFGIKYMKQKPTLQIYKNVPVGEDMTVVIKGK